MNRLLNGSGLRFGLFLFSSGLRSRTGNEARDQTGGSPMNSVMYGTAHHYKVKMKESNIRNYTETHKQNI